MQTKIGTTVFLKHLAENLSGNTLDNPNQTHYIHTVTERDTDMALTAQEMETVKSLIGKAGNVQLEAIVQRVKLQRTWLTNQSVRAIVIGDFVEFTARGGRVITGDVTKVNRKNIIVRESGTSFTLWKVPANLLKKVVDNAN